MNVVTINTRIKILGHIKQLCYDTTEILVEVRGNGQIQYAIKKAPKWWIEHQDGYLIPATIRKWLITFKKGFRKGELRKFLEENEYRLVKV